MSLLLDYYDWLLLQDLYQFSTTREHLAHAIDQVSIMAEPDVSNTRILSYNESLALLPEILDLLREQGSAYLPPVVTFVQPRRPERSQLRETLMMTTCIGTFSDAKLSSVSFHSVMANAARDGPLCNITSEMISDLSVCKQHLALYLQHVYRLTGEHTKNVKLFIQVATCLAADVKAYLVPLLGHVVKTNTERTDMTIIRININDAMQLILSK